MVKPPHSAAHRCEVSGQQIAAATWLMGGTLLGGILLLAIQAAQQADKFEFGMSIPG